MADSESTIISPLFPYLTQWYNLFPTQYTYSDGDNQHNPFPLEKWREADEILLSYVVRLWHRVGPPGLKNAYRASDGESTAWVEGEKDS